MKYSLLWQTPIVGESAGTQHVLLKEHVATKVEEEHVMSDTFVMSARQAAELDHAFERNGWTPSDVKELSSGDILNQILSVLRGLGEITVTKRLCHVGTVSLPAYRKKFNPDSFFTTGDGLYVWGSFRERILLAVSPMKSTKKATFTAYDLKEPLMDEEIRAELGDGHISESASRFCVYFAELLTRQKNGEKGDLLVNGYANIAYVRGVNSKVFAVSASWDSAYRRWVVIAGRLDGVHWSVDSRILSSNC